MKNGTTEKSDGKRAWTISLVFAVSTPFVPLLYSLVQGDTVSPGNGSLALIFALSGAAVLLVVGPDERRRPSRAQLREVRDELNHVFAAGGSPDEFRVWSALEKAGNSWRFRKHRGLAARYQRGMIGEDEFVNEMRGLLNTSTGAV